MLSATPVLIRAPQARALIESKQVDVIDARDLKAQIWLGHIPGAIHLPWRALTQGKRDGNLVEDQELLRRLDERGLSPNRPILIYAGWQSGWGEEARAMWSLEYAGHRSVQVLEGGWDAWRAAGGARAFGALAERIPVRPQGSQAERLKQWHVRPELRVTSEQVEDLLQAGWHVLDTRTQREYLGDTPYGSPVGGHLAGARHLEWSTLLDGQQLLQRKDLIKRFRSVGVELQDPIFVYCTGGVRSAFVYLVLRNLGAKNVRNYDGSWWEWSKRLSLPRP